ncbi:hypothetical protein [Rathayibacter iranicus]|uniref:hypothetical protein n=1 Tax=Rathayibacter iranicus TaxID=59737 RepID=UPI0013266F8C|nr:hypothetical protein [Rathayibacter iranicus]MWV32057.1 hypothetical protein [Rathayibacter iranicus NCPPB 2253 = VKM Ac-1602]
MSADVLRNWASGDLALEAAIELLIRFNRGQLLSGPWIRRNTVGGFWFDAEMALSECGHLSGGERRVLAIVCSLASGDHPVDLGDAITGIDHDALDYQIRVVEGLHGILGIELLDISFALDQHHHVRCARRCDDELGITGGLALAGLRRSREAFSDLLDDRLLLLNDDLVRIVVVAQLAKAALHQVFGDSLVGHRSGVPASYKHHQAEVLRHLFPLPDVPP